MSINLHSETWQALAKHLDEELVALRERLELVGLPQPETEALRGQIVQCKKILALANPPVRDGGGTPDYGLG